MNDIDQSGVIEQLAAENKLLRETLQHSPDREIQIAAAFMMIVDELTRLGPSATQRVLMWAFSRYGISQHVYVRDIRDRRPKPKEEPPPAPVVKQEPIPEPLNRHAALRRARVAAGLTQTALAERTGIAASRISQIEIGNTKPTEETWRRLEAGLNGETQ